MASKDNIILAIIGLAVVGFIVYYFFFEKKTPQVQSTTSSPLSAIERDVSSFVNDVKSGFNKVLSAGENVISGLKKDIGWGERELGNTVGFITTGASRFGRSLITDTEHFIQGVKDVFGNVEKTLSVGGIEHVFSGIESTVSKDIEKAGSKVEKTVESIPRYLYSPADIFFKDFEKGVSEAPKETKTVASGIDSFVNEIKSLLSRF